MMISHAHLIGFFKNINLFKKRSNAHLLALSKQLSLWNIERISIKHRHGQSHELSLEDVNSLKEMINATTNIAAVKCSEVFVDQMLFLVLGAVQVQSQTGSDQAWKLVNQSIQSYLHSQKEKRIFLFGLVSTAFLICMSTMTMMHSKMHPVSVPIQNSPIELTAGTANPVTISTLLLAYNKMKSGVCQLPQAAMLPPEQRQAFLLFVNKGAIEVQHVENLRLALGYVNCLYPQELMHPPAPL